MWGGFWLAHFAFQYHQHNGTNSSLPILLILPKALMTSSSINVFKSIPVSLVVVEPRVIKLLQGWKNNCPSFWYFICRNFAITCCWSFSIIHSRKSKAPFQSSLLRFPSVFLLDLHWLWQYHRPFNYKIKHCSCSQFHPCGRLKPKALAKLREPPGSQP